MLLTTVKGLVLRETPIGEADKLFDLFTENGVLSVRARGVRKAGSKYAAVTQSFAYGEYCLRQNGDFYYLDSAVPISLFYGIRSDLEALALCAYFSELIRKTATNQPEPQRLRLFLHCLHYLSEQTRPIPQIKAIFELRLVTELGHMPNLLCCSACGEFLPEQLTLRIADGDFLCKDCAVRSDGLEFHVRAAVLLAARHIVFSEFEKLFLFKLDADNLRQLCAYSEAYLRHSLDISCKTLQFYHSVAADTNLSP
ncbi:MAG: DNA repair protein RecO [Oscillospiraceae bacterium]|nr:DNA repair protein RecO [Oscillospiraceae bacterium]